MASPALGATLTGNVYDEELSELNDVVIEVNSTPWQRFVSKDGSYRFNLQPGEYEIKTKYTKDDIYLYTSTDIVKITDDGEFVFDLFLFPDLDDAIDLLDTTGDELNGGTEPIFEDRTNQPIGFTAIITAMIILFAILIYAYYWRTKQQKNEMKEINKGVREAKKRAKEHPADKKVKKVLKEMEDKERLEKEDKLASETEIILEILRKEGGRATQKEIRKHIPLSEAKISLMIAELEHSGKVKKVKKGRGNIIILND